MQQYVEQPKILTYARLQHYFNKRFQEISRIKWHSFMCWQYKCHIYYDRVINLFISQFLAKIDPKILAQFFPSVDSDQGCCKCAQQRHAGRSKKFTLLLAQEEKKVKLQAE